MKLEQKLKRIKNTIEKYYNEEKDISIANELNDLANYLEMILDNIYEIKNNNEEYIRKNNKLSMVNGLFRPYIIATIASCDKMDNSHFIDDQINKEFIKNLLEKYLE